MCSINTGKRYNFLVLAWLFFGYYFFNKLRLNTWSRDNPIRQHDLLSTLFSCICVSVFLWTMFSLVCVCVCNLLCLNNKFEVQFREVQTSHFRLRAECCKCEFAEAANNSRLFFFIFIIRPVTFVSSENSD